MALLGVVAPEDQGDGVRDHPLPGVEAHPAVLPGHAEQQVCAQKPAGTAGPRGPLPTPTVETGDP